MVFNYYKIVNKVNQKTYIGITEKSLDTRWSQHKRLLKQGKHPNYKLQAEWIEYGEDKFEFVKIESLECETIDLGYEHEYKLIQDFNGEKYNILIGGKINPMYTPEAKEKMIQTKQNSVPNILQLEEVEENVFKVIGKFNSQKEAGRKTSADQGNIQHALKKHTKGCGYYWIEEMSKEDFEKNWKPRRTKITPCARLNEQGEIIEVHHNRSIFEKNNKWTTGSIKSAIQRKGKAYGIKFINITEEEYYKLRPITLII